MSFTRLLLCASVFATVSASAGVAAPALATADVNMRKGPATTFEVVTLIPGGSTVDVSKCSGQWCTVRWKGQTGFAIARNFDTGAGGAGPEAGVVDEEYEAPVYGPPPVYVGPPGYYGGPYYRRGWGGWHRW